jgi:poly-gamma-glutamate synthesis protein (capsule biosynthesis protein)
VTTLAYFLSGVAKLTGPLGGSWAVGESLRTQVAWDVWRKELLVANPPRLIYSLYDKLWLFTLLAAGTLVIELGAPLVMLSGWLAAIWVPAALGMHWGIEMIMGIEFPYQLYGVAFAPFIPFDRVVGWVVGAGRWTLARMPARKPSAASTAGGWIAPLCGSSLLLASSIAAPAASAESPSVEHAVAAGYPIVWVGDILLGDGAEKQLAASGYEWPFEHVGDMLAGAYVVGNAEGPITTGQTPFYPEARWSYNASPRAADALASVGINAVSLANNHAFDRGPAGLIDTRDHLDRAGIQYFGAGLTIDEASRPLLIPTPHGTVAVLGFSAGGQQRPAASEGKFGILQIDADRLTQYRARAIDEGARWVVAFVHWGSNYTPISGSQRRAASAFSEAGFDLVIGHHPHVVQPVEIIGDMPVVYSIGNFVFGSTGRFTPEFPGFGLVVKTLFEADGMKLEMSCIVTDNKIVKFQPRRCDDSEAQYVASSLGSHVIWRDGKGHLTVK